MAPYDILKQIDLIIPNFKLNNPTDLTPTQRRRLNLRVLDGYSRSEIASLEKVTPKAVSNTFKEILRKTNQ